MTAPVFSWTGSGPAECPRPGHNWTNGARTVAPSTELRTWYHHEPERFDEFTRRYLDELATPERTAALVHLRDLANHGSLTLLTATKSTALSEAAVLATLLIAPGTRP